MTAPTVDIFEKSDPSRNEVSIRAGLEGTGLTVKARSRAVSALDRLVGSALDIPGIWLEHRAERARLIAISEQEAMKRDAIDFLEDRNLNVNRVFSWLGDKDNVRRIENRSAVAVAAIDDLQNACPTQDNKLSNNNGEDWEDWLNAFVHRAEMAPSDKMREVFGKILAGEIVSPGSFSVTTLRIVSELDQKTARKFQELCLRRFGERFIVKFDEDWKGQALIDLYGLEERGLLKEVGGYTNIDLSKNDEGFYDLDDGSWRLRMVIEPINEFIPVSTRVSKMLFTSSGIQLASLLQNSHTEGLRSVARIQTKREAVKFIELGNVVEGTFTSVEIILDRRMSSGQDVDI